MTKINAQEISLYGDLDGETVGDVIKMLQKFGPDAKFKFGPGTKFDMEYRLWVVEPINEA